MFSFSDYREIICIIKDSEKSCTTYKSAYGKDKFVLMRHDVEYSVERAYDLARVETSMDFCSTYFFQWTNNSYNLLSKKNQNMIYDIHERGHNIGLHFALNGMTDIELIKKQIEKEMTLLSEFLNIEITEFSIHRPSKDILRANVKLPGKFNAYQDEYFTFKEDVKNDDILSVKYMSDANHIWRYGYPDFDNINDNNKVQILIHPFAWTEKGYDNYDNYRYLVREKYDEMINSIDAECKDFWEYKESFMSVKDKLL